jgi:hypothetical protein
MNARQRINGSMADWTAFPLGIKDRSVAVLGKHQGLLVPEHAGGSFDERTQTVLLVTRIGQQTSKAKGFSGYSVGSSSVPG